MKNLYHTLMLFMAQIVSLASYAHDFSENGIFYNYVKNSKKTIEVTYRTIDYGLYLYSGEITIPEKVTHLGKTYTVVGIGERAFAQCDVTKVTVPNSVTYFGVNAFAFIKAGWFNVNFPEKLDSIGDGCFMETPFESDIFIPSKWRLGVGVFYWGKSSHNVEYAEGHEKTGEGTFFNNKALLTVILPSTMQIINRNCFASCSNIKEIVCKAKVPPIAEDYAFYEVKRSCKVYVPIGSGYLYQNFPGWKDLTIVEDADLNPEITTVIDKIDAIGTVEYSEACKKKIDDARSAYDGLEKEKKEFVYNYSTLTDAEKAYEDMKNAANLSAAKEVVNKINAIGTVEYTEACKHKIDDARSAYNALNKAQKTLVTNYKKLTDAEKAYDDLKKAAETAAANLIAANAVIDKIDAIGIVEYTETCKNKIDDARSAYNALTDAQKELVTNYKKLTDAENAYKLLEDKTNGIVEISKETVKKDGKFLVNNKIVIVKNGKKYNMSGLQE